MKSENLAWKIANALLNADLVKAGVTTILLEDVIARQMPAIDTKSKKKVHWRDPRQSSDGPVCGGGRGKSLQITPDKSQVTCRRCRATYLFDGQPARY